MPASSSAAPVSGFAFFCCRAVAGGGCAAAAAAARRRARHMGRAAAKLGAAVGVGQNLLTLAFWGMLAADHAGHVSLIDEEYKATGFCRASVPTHGFDSYQACFVVDMLGCVVLLGLCWGGNKHSSATVGPAASIFMHGIFHLSQFLFGWPMPMQIGRILYPLFTLAFVGGFGVGFKAGNIVHLLVISSAIELFRVNFVSDPFVFAYTNTWIYVRLLSPRFVAPQPRETALGPCCISLSTFCLTHRYICYRLLVPAWRLRRELRKSGPRRVLRPSLRSV